MDNHKVVKVGNTKFWIEDGILFCQFLSTNNYSKLDLNKVEEYIKAIEKMCQGNPMPFVVDIRGVKGAFTPEAGNLMANSPILKSLRISEAFILNSIGAKLLIASYKRIYDSTTPHGIFGDIRLAKQYCIETKNDFYGRE
ncbi:hypothetical protein [Meridianimaribacter flavus]|uniref:DUF7793 domain-containing protein n=1 Tax=Meridianimaribacter flavus TaxID=571115 RepID=A0ABY2G4Y3_9FLAO|nr:hypothetical protein [Meridianimaribacter flavus]RYH74031.1 hypothetical protein EVU94_08550 [Flavobacteriaceae bacterium 144Ye]TDY11337.1 hypothetical protein A8975_1974 [Meridianimaribacter flavus]